MAKRRLYELAKERGLESSELLEALAGAGVEGKSALSTMEEAELDDLLKSANGAKGSKAATGRPPSATTNGAGPAGAGPLSLGERIRLMRRRRQLRKLHRSKLEEVAGIAIEHYRLDSAHKVVRADKRV